MMIAVMQPYFLPYVGYFQLMHAADVFIFYDNAQYLKGGWVNRNRILINSRPRWFTLPVRHAQHHLPINERHYALDTPQREKLKRTVRLSYRKAPEFESMFPFISQLLDHPESNVALYNAELLTRVAQLLGISCAFAYASQFEIASSIKGQQKIIRLCKAVGGTDYVNPIGGSGLYARDAFSEAGLKLHFLDAFIAPYPQYGAVRATALSILDVLMFNDISAVRDMLGGYRLTAP